MVDLLEDEQTLDQSNSGESEDQTGDSGAGDQELDQSAGDAAGGDESGDAEGDKKPRGEVRHERYIDKLAGEIRASNDQSSRYTEEIFSPKPYNPLEYKEGEEYDTTDLKKDRDMVASNKFAEGMQQGLRQGSSQVAQELWADRFEGDAERVASKYAALDDSNTETYDPKLEAVLVQKYIAFTGMEKDANGRVTIQKPNIRFRDFVEAEMKNLEDYASRHRQASANNVRRQASQAGVRPSGQARASSGGHGFDPNDPVGSVNRMTSKQYFELGGKEASDAYLAERGIGAK